MLNYIWLGLIVLAVVIGGWNGQLKDVADKSLDMANTAVVGIAFTLIGVMALWLGIMRLAERSGLVSLFAWLLGPVMRRIFPDVPRDHPAMGSMLMNIAANLLGLNNAATPLGLRAMKDLESLNKTPGTATNAMCTFLAINTSGVQLVPVTAIAMMVANKSANPTAIVAPSLICSTCGAIAGVLMARFLSTLPIFRVNPAAIGSGQNSSAASKDDPAKTAVATDKPAVNEAVTLQPIQWWGGVIIAAFLLFFVYLFLRMSFPITFGLPFPTDPAKQTTFNRIVGAISELSIPLLLSAIPLYAILRRVKVYEEFVDGAKEGFNVAIKIIPYLVAMLVAISMFRAAGGIAFISGRLTPVFNFLHFPLPPDLLPMVLIRPLSGSGSLGFFTEIVKNYGPDSLIARTAGTIYGSTETTFYVLAVYFGSVAITRTRHAVLAGLTADFVSMVVAVYLCRMMFG